jgi:hypothetical protein
VRRTVLGIAIALVGTGCIAPSSADPAAAPRAIEILASPTPFTQVNAGPVSAIVPDDWEAHPAATTGFRGGFLASPHPERWGHTVGGVEGMSATWVDATRVGVPSDFYYLAATGPLLSTLTDSRRCSPESHRVFVDRRPDLTSPTPTHGDYVARGEGTCEVRGVATRWAYFVAAPGFGPVHEIGIPASGLYVVVAVTPEGDRASSLLDRLIRHTSFGGSTVDDLVRAADAEVQRAR